MTICKMLKLCACIDFIAIFIILLPHFSDGQVHIDVESRRMKVQLETVLQFISGSSAIPPLGFDETPTINDFN